MRPQFSSARFIRVLVSRPSRRSGLALLLSVLAGMLAAAFPAAAARAQAAGEGDGDGAVRVFLDCDGCDFTYVRRAVPFVDYVRNRDDADVHVLVTDQRTGGGGETFTLAFLGRGRFEGLDQRLRFATGPDATDETERRGFAGVLRRGLVPYVAQTPAGAHLRVVYEPPGGGEAAAEAAPPVDPWNAWVFDVGLGGSFSKEEQQSRYSLDASASADRITEAWRLESEVDVDYDERNFERSVEENGETTVQTITSTAESYEFDVRAVRALGRHWSAGVFAEAFSSTRVNTRLAVSLQPAVEVSVFPYRVAERKELTAAYYVGLEARDYREETVYEKTSEVLAAQRLQLRLNVTQPWGEAYASLSASNYFHDVAFNRLVGYVYASVRVYRGLSVYGEFEAERIRDQLFLPRGDASLEDLLLERRQLATNYELSGSVGISYTFGSIYNNVVNTRL